jgi:hypothetical protein
LEKDLEMRQAAHNDRSGTLPLSGNDLERLLSARQILSQTLPDERLHGNVFAAGIPKTYKAYPTVTEVVLGQPDRMRLAVHPP